MSPKLALFDELTGVFDARVAVGAMVMDLRRNDSHEVRLCGTEDGSRQ